MELQDIVPEKISNDLVLYKTRVGSHAYGTHTEESDEDFTVIFIQPAKNYYSIDEIKQFEWGKDKGSDVDVDFYALKYFLKGCISGTNKFVEALFTEPEDHNVCDPFGEKLLEIRDEFVTYDLFKSYGGYADGMTQKLKNDGSQPNKTGYHMIRSLYFALDILKNESICTKMPSNRQNILRGIKQGKWTKEEILHHREYIEEMIDHVKEKSDVKRSVNGNKINTFYQDISAEHLQNHF
jgi:predicted nucleotidyltransferase